MTYWYVWLVLALSQLAMATLVFVLQYVKRARELQQYHIETAGDPSSRWWWRRLAAARRLATVAGPGDRGVIRQLLLDPHPGVQSAATSCLLRYADEGLVALVIDSLATRSAAVRLYQASVLEERSALVVPLLLSRIRGDAPPAKLYSYIYVAETLGSPECAERVASLSIHQNPEVRVAVAKVLQRWPNEATLIKLLTMLRDPDWRVRAQAARGLGAVRDDDRVVQELARALTDQTWWVRFRAALALATVGAAGRAALEAARTLPDRYARDMAGFVTGLSASSVAELSQG